MYYMIFCYLGAAHLGKVLLLGGEHEGVRNEEATFLWEIDRVCPELGVLIHIFPVVLLHPEAHCYVST